MGDQQASKIKGAILLSFTFIEPIGINNFPEKVNNVKFFVLKTLM